MSASDRATVRVIADAAYPTAEVCVFDQSLSEVASSVGSLDTQLKPGIYKIKYIAGRQTAEQVFEVPAESVQVTAPKPELHIASPIFLAPDGQASLDPGTALATSVSTNIELGNRIGAGGELLIVVRSLEGEDGTAVPAADVAIGLKLCDRHGNEMRDVGKALVSSADGVAAACSFALEPGAYLLRSDRDRHRSVEQAIVVIAHWQTQIFLPAQPIGSSPTAAEADLSEAGVLMAWNGQGFLAERSEAAWAELSRQALADRRPSPPVDLLQSAVKLAKTLGPPEWREPREMPAQGFIDPMLGIYSAHLLTLCPSPDKGLLREVADSLRQLIGDHPDVLSLYLWLDPNSDLPPFWWPPMLRNSWNILIGCSHHRPELVPAGSYSSRIAERLWGAGAWLTWRVPDRLSWSAPPATPVELNKLSDLLMKSGGVAASFVKAAEELHAKMSLPEPERRLLGYLDSIARSASNAGDFAREGVGEGLRGAVRSIIVGLRLPWIKLRARQEAKDNLKPESIVQSLGMPEATLAQATGDLITKFKKFELLPVERLGARTIADVLAEEFVALHPDAQLEDKTLEGVFRSIHGLPFDRRALCLAGDGLCGAFFGLGVLEGLARYGLINQFHYLSTVSGGSYIGAWLSAWRYHDQDDTAVLKALASRFSVSPECPRRHPVAQLREANDDLTGRRGFLSAGMWTRYGARARNLLLTWLVYGPLFLTLLMIPKIYLALVIFSWEAPTSVRVGEILTAAVALFVTLTVREIRKTAGVARRGNESLYHTKQGLLPLSMSAALLCAAAPTWLNQNFTSVVGQASAVGAILFAASWLLAHAIAEYPAPPPKFWRWCGWTLAGAIGALLFAAALHELAALTSQVTQDPQARTFAVVVVAVILLASVVAEIVYLGLMSRLPGDERDQVWQAVSAGNLSAALVAWLILAWLDLFGPAVLSESTFAIVTIGGVSGAVGGVSGALALAMGFGSLEVSKWRKVVGTASVYLAEAAAVALLAILAIILSANADAIIDRIGAAILAGATETVSRLVATVGAGMLALVLTLATAYAINLSAFSRHEAQRAHLVRRFLGAAAANTQPKAPQPDAAGSDDLPMRLLWKSKRHPDARCLFPVVNMALDHFGDKHRQTGGSFTVTPLSSGSALFGYRSSADYCASEGGISLGTAMVISGGGANDQLTRHTTPLVALVLTVLAMRPGLWLGNPRSDTASRRSGPRLPFIPSLEEIFGWAPRDYIHISNGARFEALGLYEMVRRRCKFIVVSDAGSDPNCTLEHLGNAVRRIRVDFGVVIDLRDLGVHRRQTFSASTCCALAEIRYPEAPNRPGVLVYLRPALDGTEPPDVRSYAASRPLYPHEHLSDWRFGEADSESYRVLGSYTVDRLCGRGHLGEVAPGAGKLSPAEFVERVQQYLAARAPPEW